MGWTVRGSNSSGDEIFLTRPDRHWGPPSLLYNGQPAPFPGVQRLEQYAGPSKMGPIFCAETSVITTILRCEKRRSHLGRGGSLTSHSETRSVRHFAWSDQQRCLDSLVSYEKEVDIGNKLNNYLKITGLKNNALRPQETLKKRRGKLYSSLALPVLLHGSENWIIQARDARRVTATEMKHMRATAGYTWTDDTKITEIAKGLNITPVLDKMRDYRRNWVWNVNRMPRNKLLRIMKNYTP